MKKVALQTGLCRLLFQLLELMYATDSGEPLRNGDHMARPHGVPYRLVFEQPRSIGAARNSRSRQNDPESGAANDHHADGIRLRRDIRSTLVMGPLQRGDAMRLDT